MNKFKELTISNFNREYEEPLIEVCKKLGSIGTYSESLLNTKDGEGNVTLRSYFEAKTKEKHFIKKLNNRLQKLHFNIDQKCIKIGHYCSKNDKNEQKLIKIDSF